LGNLRPTLLKSTFAVRGSYRVKGFQTASAAQPELPLHKEDEDVKGKPFLSLTTALKPKEVVDRLNNFIIGQDEAKRAVAIALRNRWRRHQLGDELRNEVMPKNILMIGPTGCGKTEIARRIAKLSQAPFIKVEATKFTEVGFHGKDVDSIIKDLVETSINMTKKRLKDELRSEVQTKIEDQLITAIAGDAQKRDSDNLRTALRNGDLEDLHIDVEVEVPMKPGKKAGLSDMAGLESFLEGKLQIFDRNGRVEKRRVKVSEARPLIEKQEIDKLLEEHEVVKEAITAVEQNGIVFIDEIDKIISTGDHRGADASSEGVQRDLLPLIEGTTISTKHGNVNTDFILFIASGAFHSSKPSDLLAELQGRLPIRVSLKALTENDFYRILTEPVTNLLRQQVELLKAENVELVFRDDAIREIAKVAYLTNKTVENIGARRLHTILERVVENISFEAPETPGKKIEVTAEYVRQRVEELLVATDLRRYII